MPTQTEFKKEIIEGIPKELPPLPTFSETLNRAPKRPLNLGKEDVKLAIRNALRYFPTTFHADLIPEFYDELQQHGHIYMYRFAPTYSLHARPLHEIPHKSLQCGCIMLMILNNLDPAVAQHPLELITYGGNGAVFQNWAQYRIVMQRLAQMTDEETLVLYSGHPLGVFPSHRNAPRVVVTNGMMVPNYSSREQFQRLNALGVTNYGQMTAGSFMYIGPQGIVHGTTLTILNAIRQSCQKEPGTGLVLVTSGLGGMSGAQAKAGKIAGAVTVVAEINKKALDKRHQQGWLDEIFTDLTQLQERVVQAQRNQEAVSLGYQGNIVDLWEHLAESELHVDLGSDQTSLHNPFGGGYYPAGLSLEEANELMASQPEEFEARVRESLRRQVKAINKLALKGMYFFDYGNGFLLEAARAEADILTADGSFRYPSYVQDIMGPICFDYGFGPFRWICCSCLPEDLRETDLIATTILNLMLQNAPDSIKSQLQDNLKWIETAESNQLVVGSQARILYANAETRIALSRAFNDAIAEGKIKGPIVLGRDHHGVSGTDSPYRETSDIYDGSNLTADMSVQNVIGDGFRGATWISLHNGGGVGWGEVINGGFGLVLDGTPEAAQRAASMLQWDVYNGISRRAWAGNAGALETLSRAPQELKVTLPNQADEALIDQKLASLNA